MEKALDGDAEGYHKRGEAYKNKKEYDTAIADYTEAIRLKPDLAGAYNSRGDIYAEKGEAELARLDREKALELQSRGSNVDEGGV
jgi:tetratricopeptide (TPR) repeat protein